MLWGRSMRAKWSFVIAVVAVGGATIALRRRRKAIPMFRLQPPGWSEWQVDEAVEESFPASDPPAWTLGQRIEAEQPA